jgi:choline-sulfatase
MRTKTTKKTQGIRFSWRLVIALAGPMFLGSSLPNIENYRNTDQAKRPNILFICSDQHSYKYTGYAGHPLVKTPNLDMLAREGTAFTSAYSGAPVCVPGRASLMTGMFASDVGSYCNSTVWDGTYPVWGTYFKDNGYDTRAFGKLDLDDTRPMGFPATAEQNGHRHNPDITSLFRMPLAYRVNEREQINGHARNSYNGHDLRITEEAIDFITGESQKLDKPWLMYLGYIKPHPPFVALQKFFDQYYPDHVDVPEPSEEELENMSPVYQQLRHYKGIATPIDNDKMKRARAGYYGMISELDELIGRVILALKESGQYNNTIVIYTSDHGESLGDHGLWLKNNLYDCAIRVPLIIKGPGIPADKKIDMPVSQIDLTPTLLDLGTINRPSYLRGKDLDRFFKGEARTSDNVVYAENHSEGNCTGSFMIRKGDWKYIYFSYYNDLLFDLKNDPGETRNLADSAKYAKVIEDMKKELFERVNPDRITANAFIKQKGILDSLIQNNSEEQLIDLFKSRMGEGQAKILVKRLEGEF